MNWKRATALGLAGLAAGAVPMGALAAEADWNEVYCFSQTDFSEGDVRGLCITCMTGDADGKLLLGNREILPGDVLTAQQLAMLTFAPAGQEEPRVLEVGYLPIFNDGPGQEAVFTLNIRGRENKAPAAEDQAGETYKNLPLEGTLKVRDPEGEQLTFQLVRSPKRGNVELRPDGTFAYTPKKNKVGIDSFVYTATDESGKVSREATVTITILKAPADGQYTDTQGLSCRFAAEWMKNTGIFVGERLDGNACFQPERTVTRGEFTAMLVNALDLMEPEEVDFTGYEDQIPGWLRPYVAAALRSGLTAGLPNQQTFGAQEGIPWSEAMTMVRNALDQDTVETLSQEEHILTRAEAAELVYMAVKERP